MKEALQTAGVFLYDHMAAVIAIGIGAVYLGLCIYCLWRYSPRAVAAVGFSWGILAIAFVMLTIGIPAAVGTAIAYSVAGAAVAVYAFVLARQAKQEKAL